MNFESILYKAQKNEQNSKQNVGYYKTTFAPPKKEQREKKLSANIQKFLAKKEEEEKLKRREAERKKQELLELRNKDKKSFKRVKSMLTKTKSANKSVIEDAVDNVNTALTANGPLQPDEDDYGYVSKDAEEMYNKLISKYSSMPADDRFSKASSRCSKDISGTKDRVKAALQREEDEKFLPRKRKRKSKTGEGEEDDRSEDEEKDEKHTDVKNSSKPEKFRIPKKTASQPPPLDFQSLLKIAEKKQHEPIVIEKKVEEKPARPMTQKEKLEFIREKERRLRKEMGISESTPKANELKKKPLKSKPDALEKNPNSAAKLISNEKSKNVTDPSPNGILKKSAGSDLSSQKLKNSTQPSKNVKIVDEKSETSKDQKNSANPEKPVLGVLSERQRMILAHKRNAELETKKRALLEAKRKEARLNMNRSEGSLTETLSHSSISNPSKSIKHEIPVSKMSKPTISSLPSKKIVAMKSAESKKPMSSSIQSKQFPPPDVLPRKFPPPDIVRKHPKPMMKRKVIESDDEYDSEMDDFIDDSGDPNEVSQYISEIFGYDRRKYAARDYEDDDECMESNFAQLQKEEFISAKCGILEDLEDVRRTKLQKMRKKKRLLS